MRTREGLSTLLAELNGDVAELARVAGHNRRAWERIGAGARDVLDYGALAFTIHSVYGIIENYFLRVSKYFENNLPSDTWHRTLVDRMALDVPGLRPAFFPEAKDRDLVLEILRFRHRIRNLYGEDLNPELTDRVQAKLLVLMDRMPNLHAEFARKLQRIAEAL